MQCPVDEWKSKRLSQHCKINYHRFVKFPAVRIHEEHGFMDFVISLWKGQDDNFSCLFCHKAVFFVFRTLKRQKCLSTFAYPFPVHDCYRLAFLAIACIIMMFLIMFLTLPYKGRYIRELVDIAIILLNTTEFLWQISWHCCNSLIPLRKWLICIYVAYLQENIGKQLALGAYSKRSK